MPSVQNVPVTVENAANAGLPGRVVTLVSSDPTVATVPASVTSDGSGVATYPVTAVGLGACDITESCEGKAAVTHVTVGASDTVASVDVSPNSATVAVGDILDLSATPRNSSGAPLSDPVVWASDNEAVATVDQNGVVTGVAAGTANITATDGAVVGTAAITVQAATATRQLLWEGDSLALTDGQAVSPWIDQVASVAASQSNSTAKPAYVSNAIGGHPGVDFELGDQLRFTMPTDDSAQITRIVILRPGTTTPSSGMIPWSTPMAKLTIRTDGSVRFEVNKVGGQVIEWQTAAAVVTFNADHELYVEYDASDLNNDPTFKLDGAVVAMPLFGGGRTGARVADTGTAYLGTGSGVGNEILGPMAAVSFLASVGSGATEEARLNTKYGIA